MKAIVVLFFFSFLFQWSIAQSSIQGQTIDVKEKPVPFVNVFMVDKAGKETGVNTVTDSVGKYLFGNLLPGKYYLKFSRTGYKTQRTKAFTVVKDLTTFIDAQLLKE